MNNDNIIKFHSKADREKEKHFKDMLTLYACFESLEDIAQEINLVVGQFGVTPNDVWLTRMAAECFAYEDPKRLYVLSKLLELHGENLKLFAGRLNDMITETDDSKIIPISLKVSPVDEKYVETHRPIIRKHIESALKQFENFEH